MDNLIKELKRSKKMNKFARTAHSYKFMKVEDYNKLKPLTYTILTKKTEIETVINGKLETKHTLQRGDYVMCGKKGEKYGHKLEKVLDLFDIGIIKNKEVIRTGFKLTKKNCKNLTKSNIEKGRVKITASWGEEQIMSIDDYILLELDNSGYYGIEKEAFKKTYKKV